MGVIAVAVQNLIKAGVTGDALVAAIADMEAAQPSMTPRQARNHRYYEKRLKTSETSETSYSDVEEIPPTPPKETTTSPKVEVVNTPPVRERVRARRLPADFSPSLLVAEELGLSPEDAEAQAANFLDYWRAKPSNAAKLDWSATWRIWCRKTVDDRARSTGPPPGRQKAQGFGSLLAEFERKQNGRFSETPAESRDAGVDRRFAARGNGHGAEWRGPAAEPSSDSTGPIIDLDAEPRISRSK